MNNWNRTPVVAEPYPSGGQTASEALSAAESVLSQPVREALVLLGCQVIEMRFFGGLEVAEALEVSERTVKRDWRLARAWLFRELTGKRLR